MRLPSATLESEVGITLATFQPSRMGSRSATPLLRNPTGGAPLLTAGGSEFDFGDEGAVDWAFLGNLKQLRALLLG